MTDWLPALTPSGSLPPRARMHSDAPVLDLAGMWDFSYRPSPDAPPGEWTPIRVPGCWQLQGHGRPGYLSAQFPFALDPPHLPDANPVGTYRRTVDVPEGFERAVLRCDGIDSTGLVSVDGVVLGWTKGARLSHEFPVSLTPGSHEVVVRVAQFSATSYVEDQDMVRLSGIFRDIALVARPVGGIDDCVVVADYDPATGRGSLDLGVTTTGEVSAWLDGRPVPVGRSDVGPVDPWSADAPRLYELVLATDSEQVRCHVGFRRVEISDGLLQVNGTPVRFRGVNRHDVDADTGRTVTPEQVREDLLAMKRAHLNALRTSHYPPLPYLLDVADELGLYVVEEGDIETHAFVLDQWRNNPSDDPAWAEAYVDRTARMVRRDRHHPSVVMWSLGNEAGAGSNFLVARDWLRAEDPTRPIHYERDPSYAPSDVFSVMYPELDRLERIATGEEEPSDKPILLCEYAHAMGAGPGGLSEYEALFDAHPRLQGGFVWEWRDHTLRLPTGRLGYGGDFGEPLHDGAFAADGLHHGDGTPKPGLADLAAVMAPVRVDVSDGWDAATVTHRENHPDRTSTALAWSIDDAGGEVASGVVEAPVAVVGTGTVPLPLESFRHPGRVLTVRAVSSQDRAWAAAGHELGAGQAHLGLDKGRLPASTAVFGDVGFTSLGDLAELSGVSICGPTVGLWRAPTDNDHGYAMRARGQVADEDEWETSNLAVLSRRTVSVAAGPDEVTVETWTAPYSRSFGVRSVMRWTPVVGGAALTADLVPEGEWPCSWARCGLDWLIPGIGPDTVLRWQGRGPGRAGVDVGQAARHGWFTSTVADWQVPHARPQDDGVRAHVTRLAAELPDGRELVIDSELPLWVSARPWTDAQIAAANHPDELGETGVVVLSLNAAVHGYGTGACGPGVAQPHQLLPRPLSWRFSITIA